MEERKEDGEKEEGEGELVVVKEIYRDGAWTE